MKKLLYPLVLIFLFSFKSNAQTDASLSDISLSYMPNSLTSNWFHPDTLDYDITLQFGAIIPNILATTTDPNASHQVFQNILILDTVDVLSADSSETRTYTFNWIHASPTQPVGMYLTDSTDLCSNYHPDSTNFFYLIDTTFILPQVPLNIYDSTAMVTINNPIIAGEGMTQIIIVSNQDGTTITTFVFTFITNCSLLDLSIGEDNFMPIEIYPNPVKDILHFNAEIDLKEIQIFDIQGKLLLNSKLAEHQKEMDISTLSKGMYIVKFSGNKNAGGFKISKL